MVHPFRFAVATNAGQSAADIKQRARAAEDLGYDTIVWQDHYAGPGPLMDSSGHPPQPMASIPAVVLAAEATSTIRVGFRVLCVDYHQPVVLAKELASIDVISGGRLEIGLGAGWIGAEYEAMGLKMDRPSIRIKRLAETVEFLRQAFGETQVDMRHTALGVWGFDGTPKPIQRPSPPIAIGGGGRKVLETAARCADIVGLNVDNRAGRVGEGYVGVSSAEATEQRISWIRAAAGRRIDEIEIEVAVHFAIVTDNARAVVKSLPERTRGTFNLAPQDVMDHPHVLVGSVSGICETLEQRRARYGISYITVQERSMEQFAPVVARLSQA